MQEFVYLVIGGDHYMTSLSPEAAQRHMEKWMAWIGRMRAAGIYKGGNPLRQGGKTLSGADKVVTDGPFAEAREVVGGYMIVAVKDIDAAVAEATNCPILEGSGRIEVRAIQPM